MRLLALQGADIVVAPAAWVNGFDSTARESDSDRLLAQAEGVVVQANLNQVAVVAVSQVGSTSVARNLGGSIAVDAFGRLLAPALSRFEPSSTLVSVALDSVRGSRHRGPRINPRDDRRRDVYSVMYRGRSL